MQGARNSSKDRISVTNLNYAMVTSHPHRLTRIGHHEVAKPWWVYQPKRTSLRFKEFSEAIDCAAVLSLTETDEELEALVMGYVRSMEPCS